jgi:hypothetical protein
MKIFFMATAILISFISVHFSIAGELAYTCKVIHVYDLDVAGSLRTSNWEKQFCDLEFSVSRVTGEIIGSVIPTSFASWTKVINAGNEKYSFKSVALFDSVNKPLSSGSEDAKTTASFQLLEIKEYHHGDSKPFVAMSMSGAGIVTGLCK